MPDAILAGTPVLTNVRRAEGPISFFHATASVPDSCRNRSGRLIEYLTNEDGEVAVYNDGGIYYKDGAYQAFARQKLTPSELSDLLRAFRDVNFDAIPAAFPPRRTESSGRPSLTLIGVRYQRVAVKEGDARDARIDALLKRLGVIADKATADARYILKRGNGIPLMIVPWPYPDIDLEGVVDPRIRFSAAAPETWRRRVPDEFLAGLPLDDPSSAGAGSDPNRAVHFSWAGKLYRVARPFHCTAGVSCNFLTLQVAEVTEPLTGDCTPGTRNCQTMTYPDGRKVNRLTDPHLTVKSGRLWPARLGVKLRDVPPEGVSLGKAEYDRHKEIYFPIMKWRLLGATFIEDGVVYDKVRLCGIDAGSDEKCEVKEPWNPVVK